MHVFFDVLCLVLGLSRSTQMLPEIYQMAFDHILVSVSCHLSK